MSTNGDAFEQRATLTSGPPDERPIIPMPTRVGRFEILKLLGEGGMGHVFAAVDPELDRKVALKVLRADVWVGDGEQGEARLRREAKAMAQLNHPNVVTVYEVGHWNQQLYVAMELVDGGTLSDWMLEQKPGGRARFLTVLDLCLQAARGLAAAHEAGVIHRDLKPANMLIDQRGRLRVADFGLANTVVRPSDTVIDASQTFDEDRLTRNGSILGTPAYMGPEQFEGTSDARSDQFSFCATFYEVFYGVLPFAGNSFARLERVHAAEFSTPIPGHSVPSRIRRILVRGLAADPRARFPSMGELLAELQDYQRAVRQRRVAVSGIGLVLGVAATAMITAHLVDDVDRCPPGASTMAAVWGDGARDTLASVFARSEVAYADQSWLRLRESFDTYASRWASAFDDACAATWIRREQSEARLDVRMRCLEERHRALVQAVDTLRVGDPAAIRKAVDVARGLPEISVCSNPDQLDTAQQRHPTPEQERLAVEVALLLQRARTSLNLGRVADAQVAVDRATEQLAGRDLLYLEAETRTIAARIAVAREDFATAATLAGHASQIAQASGEVDPVVAAFLMQSTVAKRQGDLDAARLFADLADGAAARPGLTHHLPGEIAMRKADVANVRGDIETALSAYDRAAQVFGDVLGDDAPQLADVWQNRGRALLQAGRGDEARAAFESADRVLVAAYGESHPDRAQALLSLAHLAALLGDARRSLELNQQALAITEEDPEYRPHVRLELTLGIAEDYKQLGQFADARRQLEGAEAAFVALHGAEHPEVARVWITQANLALDTLEFPTAIVGYDRVRRAWQDREAFRANRAIATLNLAVAESMNGRNEASIVHAREAVTELEVFVEPEGLEMIGYLSSIGDVMARSGATDEAQGLYERALAISKRHGGGGYLVDEARFGLAKIVGAAGDVERARRLAMEAREGLVADGDGKANALAELDAWLASIAPTKP